MSRKLNTPAALPGLILMALAATAVGLVVWYVVTQLSTPPAAPQLTAGDSCSVAPVPAPCLNFIQDVAAAQPDNTALWGIFLVGLATGFALAFVLTAPAAYKLGKDEGWNSAYRLAPRKSRQNYRPAARRR